MPSASSATPARPPGALAGPLSCQRGGGELWFSDLPAELEQAKAHCHQCPLRTACLAGSLIVTGSRSSSYRGQDTTLSRNHLIRSKEQASRGGR